jgi:hypothetical protein
MTALSAVAATVLTLEGAAVLAVAAAGNRATVNNTGINNDVRALHGFILGTLQSINSSGVASGVRAD